MEKKSRLTIDMESGEKNRLKAFCATQNISMKEFMLRSTQEKVEEIEDQLLTNEAREVLENIKSGKEKTISWDEMKKRIA